METYPVFVAAEKNGSACSRRGGDDLPRPILFFVAAEKNGPPAAAVATTILASDSNLRCRREKWFRLQNGLAAKVILDFRAKPGNRCKDFPVYGLLRALILKFKPRLENRCKLFPVYTFFRASILDFKPRLENRCKLFPVYTLFRG